MASYRKSAARDGVAMLLAAGVGSGIVFPQLSSLMSPLVFPALFVLMTFTMATVAKSPLSILTKPEPAVWGIMLWQMAFVPLLTILVSCWIMDLPPDLHTMLLASALSSSVFAAPTLARIFRIDTQLPISGMVLSTFLMPITLLLFGKFAASDELTISLFPYLWRVSMFLVLPLCLALAIDRILRVMTESRVSQLRSGMQVGSIAALLVFGVGIMDGLAETISSDPMRVLTFLALAVGFALATVAGTVVLFWTLGRDLVLAAIILNGHRNIALTYAVIGGAAGGDFAIYVAVCQIPLFLSPLLIRVAQAIPFGPTVAFLRRTDTVTSQA